MKKILTDLVITIIGNALLALSIALFILPSDVLTGGVAGIAVLVNAIIPVDESAVIFALSTGLLITGWIFLGNHFFINTCVSSFLYPILLIVFQEMFEAPVLDPMLASIYGGLIGGIGIGIVLKTGASTGGMDIPPLLLNKFFGFEIAKAVMFFDAMTVIFGLAIYGFEAVLIGLISVYMSSIAIERTLVAGGTKSKSVQIISDHYLAIQDEIYKEINRGITILDATGGYSKVAKKVLLIVVSDKQYTTLINIVNRYDKDAFVIVSDATDVRGNGFSESGRI